MKQPSFHWGAPSLRTLFLTMGIGCLSLHSSTASAQNSPTSDKVCALSDTISLSITDYAQWRAFYRKQYRDTPSNPREYRWIQLLQIGNKHQAYVNYGELRADSIWNASIKAGKSKGEFQSEWSAARKESLPDTKLLFDRSKGTLDAYDKVFIDPYHYSEAIPSLQWRLEKGDSTILGYPCHKATTRFRGRDYVAWYTEEIAYSYGPYKFGGLPGLITCIYDTQREHIYTLVGFEKAPSADYIYTANRRRKPTEGTREEINRLQRQFHEQPNLFKSDIITPASPVQVKRRPKPYNPIELE